MYNISNKVKVIDDNELYFELSFNKMISLSSYEEICRLSSIIAKQIIDCKINQDKITLKLLNLKLRSLKIMAKKVRSDYLMCEKTMINLEDHMNREIKR